MSLHTRRIMLSPRACDALWEALLPHLESVVERSLECGRFSTEGWIDEIRDNRTHGLWAAKQSEVMVVLSTDGRNEQFATELFRENLLRAYLTPEKKLAPTTRKLLGQVLDTVDNLLDVPIIDRIASLA